MFVLAKGRRLYNLHKMCYNIYMLLICKGCNNCYFRSFTSKEEITMLKTKATTFQEKLYNQDRFFFWFDAQWKLVKIYDRDYETDHFVSTEGFEQVFAEAISKLTIPAISELEARVIEPVFKKICDDVITNRAKNPYAS